jgi:hypothetical protein
MKLVGIHRCEKLELAIGALDVWVCMGNNNVKCIFDLTQAAKFVT